MLMIRDITEYKRTEALLRQSGEQLREFAARMEALREEERLTVAREIHDELGQALTILKLDLSWLRTRMSREQRAEKTKLNAMMNQVDETIDRVRRISSRLRPLLLDDLGLVAAIEWQAADIQKRTGIRCYVRSSEEKLDFEPEKSAALFRIVQEAFTNVVRHANATNVRLHLDQKGDRLKITIRDNGKGMSEEQAAKTTSLGILGMKERVARIGGEFNIFSRPGKGTRIDITIPRSHD